MDDAELSQILREQFRMLGEQIGLAHNVPEPLKPLLEGNDATVVLRLHRGNLKIVLPIPVVEITEEAGSILDVEEVPVPEEPVTEDLPDETPNTVKLEPIKKKRRRKKKE